MDCSERAVPIRVTHDSLGCNHTYQGQGVEEPGLGSVGVLASRVALPRGDETIPLIGRAASITGDTEVIPY